MHSLSASAIILKRTNTGETDRIVTVFSREYGKMTVVAKGARKLTSSKLAALEPGNEAKIYCIETKNLPILTQAQLLEDFSRGTNDLVTMKRVFQVLEIVDSLLPEHDPHEEVYDLVKSLLVDINYDRQPSVVKLREKLKVLLELLGYQAPETQARSIQQLVEELSDRKMKSFEYLTV